MTEFINLLFAVYYLSIKYESNTFTLSLKEKEGRRRSDFLELLQKGGLYGFEESRGTSHSDGDVIDDEEDLKEFFKSLNFGKRGASRARMEEDRKYFFKTLLEREEVYIYHYDGRYRVNLRKGGKYTDIEYRLF